MIKDLTIVITNFKREEMLGNALSSTQLVNPEKIIVSSFCSNKFKIITQYGHYTFELFYNKEDLGLNQLWLQGIKEVKTKYVMILHDDDAYTHDAPIHINGLMNRLREMDIDLGVFDGITSYGRLIKSIDVETKSLKEALKKRLMEGQYSLSVVAGIFKTEVVLDALNEAEANFTKPVFFPTDNPKTMVGNDLLLWLRACDKAKDILYLKELPLVIYGIHPESLTIKLGGKIFPCYEAVKKYYLKHNE